MKENGEGECNVYLIHNSECINPMCVVPKKGGTTMVWTKKNELIVTHIFVDE